MKYGEAEDFCAEMGGSLPEPENEFENNALQSVGYDVWLNGHTTPVLGKDC